VNNQEEIGGMDDNGDAIEVEIDESKFFHRKYRRGLWRPGHCFFGGVERLSGKCFLVQVPDRRAPTFENLLVQYILPSTHIISDGWAAYANLDRIAEVVENMWIRAKQKLKRQFGNSRDLFPSYLH